MSRTLRRSIGHLAGRGTGGVPVRALLLLTIGTTPAAVAAAAASDSDATRFVYEERAGDERRTVEYLATAQRAVALGPSGTTVALYDRQDDKLWLPQTGGLSAEAIDRPVAKRIARLIDEQMQRFEEQWQSLPPAEADRARSDLRRLLSKTPTTRNADRAVATGDRGSVAGHDCAWYRLEGADGEVGRACIADAGAIAFDRSLLGMLRLVADVFATLGEAGGDTLDATAFGQPMLPAEALMGLPLGVTITDENGTLQRGLKLLRVSHEAVATELFTKP